MLWLFACLAEPSTVSGPEALAPETCDEPARRQQIAEQVGAVAIPVCLHAGFSSQQAMDGFTGGSKQATKALHINEVNRQLRGAPEADYQQRRLDTGIQLQLSSVHKYLDSVRAQLGEGDSQRREQGLYAMAADWGEPGCVDVFVLFDPDASWEGAWASYPDSEQPGALVAVNQPDPRKLAHEWGHVLGLRHTHEQAFGAEWDAPEDCDVNGDLLCDTAPDPGPEVCDQVDERGKTNAESRSWVRCPPELQDLEGQVPLDNLMSYWDPPWQSQGFSSEQADRMACVWAESASQVLGL